MSVEITPLGGLGEVGKNMTLVSAGGENIIVDMGVKVEGLLNLKNESLSEAERGRLVSVGGIPDDSKSRSMDISAIILTHGHLDHIGAVGKLANEYDATIYATPFTIELVRQVVREERIFEVSNDMEEVKPGETFQINDIEVEFIKGAHSIPQNVFPAIKTPSGVILCVGGFKVDKNPILGHKTEYNDLKKLSNEGKVISLVCSVKADRSSPTPSEAVAKKMLEKVMVKASGSGGIIVTTFSSHIARLREITRLARDINRVPVILGRSLKKKSKSAEKMGIVNFPQETKFFGHITSVREALEVINKSREDYVIITSGHQGEPNSVLARIAEKSEPYEIGGGDDVIFAAPVIPNPVNISNRDFLERKITDQGATIHRDVHVSGHAGKPGTKELLEEISPDHVVPFHGTMDKIKSVINIGRKLGFSEERLHALRNEETFKLGD